jgi:hypothetical protein
MIKITEGLASKGGHCPVCGRFFRPNGVGPQSYETLSSVLNWLPSSSILRYGANFHDWYFHLGSNWGTQEYADKIMFELNEKEIKRRCKWFNSWYYRLANKRNYLFVREFGHNYWDKDGCK